MQAEEWRKKRESSRERQQDVEGRGDGVEVVSDGVFDEETPLRREERSPDSGG